MGQRFHNRRLYQNSQAVGEGPENTKKAPVLGRGEGSVREREPLPGGGAKDSAAVVIQVAGAQVEAD